MGKGTQYKQISNNILFASNSCSKSENMIFEEDNLYTWSFFLYIPVIPSKTDKLSFSLDDKLFDIIYQQ